MKRSLTLAISIVIAGMTAVAFRVVAQESPARVVTISAKRFKTPSPGKKTLNAAAPRARSASSFKVTWSISTSSITCSARCSCSAA